MITDYSKRELTLNHFKDALTACTDIDDSRYYKEQLTIVGVYYRNPLEKHILAHPTLSIEEPLDGHLMTLKAILKPDTDAKSALDILDKALKKTGMGETYKEKDTVPIDPNVFDNVGKFFRQGTIFKEVSDYDLIFNVTEDVVKQSTFRINKQTYYQYEVRSTGILGSQLYNQTLVVLFKVKEYNVETFFSALLDKELSVDDAKNILDTIAEDNLTGLFLGAVYLENKREQTSAYFGGITSPAELTYQNGFYGVHTIESQLVFKADDIKDMKVRMGEGYTYVVSIDTAKHTIELYMS